jgi:hypothetical protein
MRKPNHHNRYREIRPVGNKGVWQYIERSRKTDRVLRVLLTTHDGYDAIQAQRKGWEEGEKELGHKV